MGPFISFKITLLSETLVDFVPLLISGWHKLLRVSIVLEIAVFSTLKSLHSQSFPPFSSQSCHSYVPLPRSYLVLFRASSCHEKSRQVTKNHEKSRKITKYHEISRKITKNQEISRKITKYHEKSQKSRCRV